MAAEPVYVVGNTHKFLLQAKRDGVVWDLTGATITLTLVDPGGNIITKSATIISASAGTAYYTTLTSDFDEDGDWLLIWRVVQGAIDLCSAPIPIKVLPRYAVAA